MLALCHSSKEVTAAVMGEEHSVPKSDQVRLSDYHQPTLSNEHVKYAVFKGYLAFQLAGVLLPQ